MNGKAAFSARAARACCTALTALAAATATFAAQDSAQPEIIRGTIASAEEGHLKVNTNEGKSVDLQTTNGTHVDAISKGSPDQITQGAYVGTAATPNAQGQLVAREVHIFAESMRGTSEGPRPYNLGPHSTMTNATVSRMGPASAPPARSGTMTNATVASSGTAAGGRLLTLTYKHGDKQGEKSVLVPPGVPVVMMEPGERSLLAPGAHVTVLADRQADGKLVASAVRVGRNGLVPPM